VSCSARSSKPKRRRPKAIGSSRRNRARGRQIARHFINTPLSSGIVTSLGFAPIRQSSDVPADGGILAITSRPGGVMASNASVGIRTNLLSIPGYYDVALRDLGLAFGAFALARLATEFNSRS
jgi:hypothetical protein